jgi:hypothetical protein
MKHTSLRFYSKAKCGEIMKKTNLALGSVLFLIGILMASTFATLVSAKDLNYPDGATVMDFYNAGGQVNITVTTPITGNYPPSLQQMQFRFIHCEIPNSKVSFDSLLVFFYVKLTGATAWSWQPMAVITTSADQATFARMFWKGTLMEIDATKYGMPANYGTDNVLVVSQGTLKVDRHGNDITLTLNKPIDLKRPFTPARTINMTLPAFTLGLNNYGPSIQYLGSATMGAPTTYPDASGYTIVTDELRFSATGTLSSTAWPLSTGTITDACVTMHGTHTFYPPSPT